MTSTSVNPLSYHLYRKGYPLTDCEPPSGFRSMPTADLIVQVIRNTSQPRHIEGLPVIIRKSPPNYKRLVDLALRYGVQNQVGYILDITKDLFKEKDLAVSELEQAIGVLEKQVVLQEQPLFRPRNQEIAALLQERERTPEERRWNVLYGTPYSGFRSQFVVNVR